MSSHAVPADPVLSCRDLTVRIGGTPVVEAVSLDLRRGWITGILGESGSGKSQLVRALTGLSSGRVEGRVLFDGQDLVAAPPHSLRAIRGRRIAYVFQNPMSALNPYFRIEMQLAEVAEIHLGLSRAQARARALEMLRRVRLPEPARRLRAFPHELSGGQRQRVVIAMALMADPVLLIADEPTTALDVTVQRRILDLVRSLCTDQALSCIFITHDIAVASHIADETLVMHRGRVVEQGPTTRLVSAPRDPYTQALIRDTPTLSGPVPPQAALGAPLLQVSDLGVRYMTGSLLRRGAGFQAVEGVSFSVAAGETLGIVGESGSGKSTIARALVRLAPVTAGEILWRGAPVTRLDEGAFRPVRREIQTVFQDPFASLNPRMRLANLVAEPLRIHNPDISEAVIRDRVTAAIESVGLEPAMASRFPHELSGGQAQRIAIARAIVSEPAMLICDEAVSALDVTVQARVLSLIGTLQERLSLAILFISHDLAVVRQVADRILVLEAGRVCELADRDRIFARPEHPYTRRLLDSVLTVEAG